MKRFRLALCGLLVGASVAQAAFPDKPIKLVVPYDPGTVDSVARVIAVGMSNYLKVPIVVENQSGASGSVGAGRVAKAPADGYTVLYGSQAVFVQNPLVYKLSYDPSKAFEPVSYGVNTGLFLLVNKSLGVHTLAELVALAKAHPGKLTYGSSGNASTGNVTGELFKKRAGVDIQHIPYKNSSTTLTDLLSNQISMFFYTYAPAEQFIKQGDLVALAYTGKHRLEAAPDVPTFAESGFPGFDQTLWFSFFVPAGTSPDVVKKLNAAVLYGVKDQAEELKKFYDYVPMPGTPAQMSAVIHDDIENFKKLKTDLNIRIE